MGSLHLLGRSIFSLGGYYSKTGGNLESSSTTLSLNDNTTIASNTAIEFDQLELNDLALTLADANTDLQILSAVIVDNPNESVITGEADLTMLSSLNISAGGVAKYATNKSEAIKLLEFLASPEGSKGLAAPTFEHPLKEVNQNQIVKNFGEFTPDEVSVEDLGNNNSMAIRMMKESGWD